MDHHHHEHGHPHEHEDVHEHNHADKDTLVQQRIQALERFTSRHGRAPTEDESLQILSHGHVHDHLEVGTFENRFRSDTSKYASVSPVRNYSERAFTIGIGGPVGSGKTALMLKLCQNLRNEYNLAAITNDIFTQEDGEFLLKHEALAAERIRAIETGGCPHAAIREDISANLQACEDLTRAFQPDFVLIESGGDNLAANYSRELADFILYVIDVAGGDKVPRKGGPGITQADVLIINKTDLAPAVGADLAIMKRDALNMRGPEAPTVFTVIKDNCAGVQEVMTLILAAWQSATSKDL